MTVEFYSASPRTQPIVVQAFLEAMTSQRQVPILNLSRGLNAIAFGTNAIHFQDNTGNDCLNIASGLGWQLSLELSEQKLD
jgi:hypothetical protein